jgi:uncharacterized damage-inducible protein DinB
MSLVEHYRAMARYNAWMNEKLYAVAAQMPDSERRRDARAFFHSIHGTLNHLLLTDRAWLWRFTQDARVAGSRDAEGEPIPMTGRLDQELYVKFEHLIRERVRTDADITAFAAALTRERLESEIVYRTAAGVEQRHMMWWALSHFFNHQTHHRGQVTTLLTQAGYDPGVTDLIAMLRDQRARPS